MKEQKSHVDPAIQCNSTNDKAEQQFCPKAQYIHVPTGTWKSKSKIKTRGKGKKGKRKKMTEGRKEK